MFLSPSKRSKGFDFDSPELRKAPRFTLIPSTSSAKNVQIPQVVGRKRKAEESTAAPDVHTKRRLDLSSAPTAPAGRSPKHKRVGILSRRRATGTSYTRIDPPASTAPVPFSITTALAGILPLKSKSKPSAKGWHFEIYEDTPVDEMQNSTHTLDISDDESRLSPKIDRDNKENIPPVDFRNQVNVPISRRDVMTDETRAPLGDLDAKHFYAEGCDANSVIIIPVEESEQVPKQPALNDPCPPSRLRPNAISNGQEGWGDLLAQLSANNDTDAVIDQPDEHEQLKEEPAEIHIWESESAKAEDDANEQNHAATAILQ